MGRKASILKLKQYHIPVKYYTVCLSSVDTFSNVNFIHFSHCTLTEWGKHTCWTIYSICHPINLVWDNIIPIFFIKQSISSNSQIKILISTPNSNIWFFLLKIFQTILVGWMEYLQTAQMHYWHLELNMNSNCNSCGITKYLCSPVTLPWLMSYRYNVQPWLYF